MNELQQKLHEILQKGPKTRPELVEETGIARTTIYDNLSKLMGIGAVTSYAVNNHKRGRPKVLFKLEQIDLKFAPEVKRIASLPKFTGSFAATVSGNVAATAKTMDELYAILRNKGVTNATISVVEDGDPDR